MIETRDGTRHLRLRPGAQIALAALALATTGWLALSTASVVVSHVAIGEAATDQITLKDAWQTRLAELTSERDRHATEARSAQARFEQALDRIGLQQVAMLEALESRRELEAQLERARARLGDALDQRDTARRANERLTAQIKDTADAIARNAPAADLAATLAAVSAALDEAALARDAAEADRDRLEADLARTALELKVASRRHEEMLEQIRQSVAESTGQLESVIRRAELDVDSLIALVRPQYTGQGGPLVPLGVSTRSFPGEAEVTSRFDTLMVDIDRMNLLRVALGKTPFALPVKDSYRFTSGFGTRRDPKGRGRRMHAGVDFAAPRGTPIYATADGVVKTAGSESGYGQTIRITHDLGFETVYAHQSKLRVKPGQRVSRGDHIGDMGSTGRSTGVHLHYEVRLNGRPVNPMTYVEAAKDVF